ALAELLDELTMALNTLPSEAEVRKALVNFNSEELYSLETVDGMARKFGTYEHLFGDYKYFKKFLADVNKVTAKDILAVARKYLDPKGINITFMTSGNQKELRKELNRFLAAYKKVYAQAKRTKVTGRAGKLKKIRFSASLEGSKNSGKLFSFKTSNGT